MTLNARVQAVAGSPCWLVWLHGFLGSQREWQPVAARLRVYSQLFIDLPGHGVAAKRAADFAAFSQQLTGTLHSYNILNYWLIGYSLGGRLAMYHACHGSGSKPQGLVVESAHPGLADENERLARRQSDRRWAQRLRHEPLSHVLADWYRQPVFASLSARQHATLVRLRSRNQPQALAAMLESTSLGRQPDLRSALARLPYPFHYLCGERDPKFRELAQQLTAPVHLIATAGHNAHRENPQAVARCLADILSHAGKDHL